MPHWYVYSTDYLASILIDISVWRGLAIDPPSSKCLDLPLFGQQTPEIPGIVPKEAAH